MRVIKKYFNEEHQKRSDIAKTYGGLAPIALDILGSMPNPIGQVCGPLTSGGKGSIEANLKVFDQTIRKLQGNGKIIFNQLPFEKTLEKLWTNDARAYEEKNMDLLENFYAPIFESGKVKTSYFIYDWKNSFGATWEHKKVTSLGLNIEYLPENFEI